MLTAQEVRQPRLILTPGVVVERDGGALFLRSPEASVRIDEPSDAITATIEALCGSGGTEDALMDVALSAGDPDAALQIAHLLASLTRTDIVRYGVKATGGVLIATSVLLSHSFVLERRSFDRSAHFALSRFALMRRDGGQLLIESPLIAAKLVLHEPAAAAVIAALASPTTLDRLVTMFRAFDACAVEELVALLFAFDMTDNDSKSVSLRFWEFHDLLFHSRNRLGRHANGYGGTHRFAGNIAPEPALRPPSGKRPIPLPSIKLTEASARDESLTATIESRTSIREYGETPINLAQLGEFLYRSARIRSIVPSQYGEIASRPYPSGGALYEQELYIASEGCSGLERGLYRYDALAHALEPVAPYNDDVAGIIDGGWRAANQPLSRPQVMIIVTARFPRIMSKYASVAYALVLKNLGALFQTMYLVATAMRLAPCALGGGDSDLFARAAGLDYYAETSVGEFMIGSRQNDL